MAALVEQEQEGRVAGGLNEAREGGGAGASRASRARAAESRAAWLFGVPAVLLCALVYAQLRARGALRSGASPEATHASLASGPRWSGRCEFEGSALELELVPLHAHGERQRFDAAALASRLGLEAGEPWALELRWLRPARSAETSGESRGASPRNEQADLRRSAAPEPTEEERAAPSPAQLPSAPAGIALQGLRIADAQGVAQLALAECAAAAGTREGAAHQGVHEARAVFDPLLQLYALPTAELAPGASARCVLWGRAPRADSSAALQLGDLRIELAAQQPAEIAPQAGEANAGAGR
jgi:hypothetical protein